MDKIKKQPLTIKILTIISCLVTVFCLIYAKSLFCTRSNFIAVILPISLIVNLFNLYYKENRIRKNSINTIIIWILSTYLVISSIYFYKEFYTMVMFRIANYNNFDYFFVLFTIPVVIYLAFKILGKIFGIVLCTPFLIVLVGQYLPYPFSVSPLSFKNLVATISLDLHGIWGTIPQAMATYVGMFIILAAGIKAFGGLESLITFFLKLLGKHEIFFPQVATIASMVFGSFSGSAMANVAGTGTFTIPMMKERGMRPEHSGGVETVASAGGGIMPPIMGIGAFIMSELLNISYLNIVIAGTLPAVLFYLITFLNTHWVRLRQMRLEKKEELESKSIENFEKRIKKLEKEYDPMILLIIALSIAILIFLLLKRISILSAGLRTVTYFYIFYFIRLFIPKIFSFVKKHNTSNVVSQLKSTLMFFINRSIDFLYESGKSLSELILLGASLGIISSVLLKTGLLYRIGTGLINISQGNVYILLLATVILCLLLGMAISALASYLLVAPIVVTSFKAMGIEPLAAHFLVFYIAAIAPLTPPIAPACALAARIANADFVKTAKASLLLAEGFILMPIVFVNYPSILEANFITFILMFGAMITVSIGLFVDFKGMKRIPNFLLVVLGLSMIVLDFSIYIKYAFSFGVLILLIICIKNLGVMKLSKT